MSRSSARPHEPIVPSARRQQIALLAALGFELGIATIDVITGNRIITNFFLVAPLALAAFGAPRQVLIAGAPALGLVVLSGVWDHYFFTPDHLLRVGS